MNRFLLPLSGLVAAMLLAGCATPSSEPAAAPAKTTAPAATPAKAAPAAATPAPAAAAPAATSASDAAMAQKLVGQWTGKWEMPSFGEGKFLLIINSAEGTNLKGEAHWFGTATGDVKLPLLSATVSNGQLEAKQAGDTTFKLSFKGDDLAGTWLIQGFNGNLQNLKR